MKIRLKNIWMPLLGLLGAFAIIVTASHVANHNFTFALSFGFGDIPYPIHKIVMGIIIFIMVLMLYLLWEIVYKLKNKNANEELMSKQTDAKAAKLVIIDIRNILKVYKIIDENTQKADISFSKYNCFTSGYDYLFAGNKPIRTKFEDNVLTIDTNPTDILFNDKIVNNETVYLKYDEHFVQKIDNSYKLVTNSPMLHY